MLLLFVCYKSVSLSLVMGQVPLFNCDNCDVEARIDRTSQVRGTGIFTSVLAHFISSSSNISSRPQHLLSWDTDRLARLQTASSVAVCFCISLEDCDSSGNGVMWGLDILHNQVTWEGYNFQDPDSITHSLISIKVRNRRVFDQFIINNPGDNSSDD